VSSIGNLKVLQKKTGQFVTIWKRNETEETAPYDMKDDFDILLIKSSNDNTEGFFIFQKSTLLENGIISNHNNGGKRGMRVYGPSDKTTSNQAIKTQKWQSNFFVEPNDFGRFKNILLQFNN